MRPRRLSRGKLSSVGRKIRCVTFDCYGTLIDWQAGIRRALLSIPALRGNGDLADALVERREEIEKGLIVSAPELPDEESLEERFESLPYRPYREILAESVLLAVREQECELGLEDAKAVAATMSDWDPFNDTREAIKEIGRRFTIALLSNAEDEVLNASIRKIGVVFDLVVSAERIEAYKPAPDHWYAAMHELKADEDEIFHLAASPFHDLETATLLGIPCGYVNRSDLPLLPEARPAFVVRDLTSAAKWLRHNVEEARSSRGNVSTGEAHRKSRGKRPPAGGRARRR